MTHRNSLEWQRAFELTRNYLFYTEDVYNAIKMGATDNDIKNILPISVKNNISVELIYNVVRKYNSLMA